MVNKHNGASSRFEHNNHFRRIKWVNLGVSKYPAIITEFCDKGNGYFVPSKQVWFDQNQRSMGTLYRLLYYHASYYPRRSLDD